MRYLKQIFILITAIIFITIPLSASAGAAFSGDDKIVVVLDPGHGGKDPGAAGIRDEAYYNLQVANYAKAALEKNGSFKVYMTRSTAGEYLTLAERMYYADTVNADCVISIHFNSSSSSSIGGVEVYGSVLDKYYLGALGQKISSKVAGAAGITNRGVFRKYDYGSTLYYWSEEYQWDIPGDKSVGGLSDYYGIITWGAKFGIPSLIVEHAYLTNSNERSLIESDDVLRKMGEADAAALIEYYTNHSHSYGGETMDAPVTCFSAGKKSVHCTICGHRKNVSSIASGPDSSKHLWMAEGESTAADCVHNGYAKYVCRYTSNLYDKGCTQFSVHRTEAVTPAYGHDYTITYHSEVTHTVDGVTTYTCSRCGDTYSETIPAEGHSYTLTSHADPTCENDGYDAYACSVCGDTYSDSIPKTGHDFEILSRTDPTCDETGAEHRRCRTCGFEEDVVLPASGHKLEIVSEEPPGCTKNGFRNTKCSVCGKEETIELEKTGHSYSVISELAPTCDTMGEIRRQCTICGFQETVITYPEGHDWEILKKTQPSCIKEGYLSKKCRVCGSEETEIIAAAGHTFDEGTFVKEPGLFTGGTVKYTCIYDSSHVEYLSVRDLTIYEYIEQHRLRFTAMCIGFAALLAAAAGTAIILIRKRRRPAHAAAKADDIKLDMAPNKNKTKETLKK